MTSIDLVQRHASQALTPEFQRCPRKLVPQCPQYGQDHPILAAWYAGCAKAIFLFAVARSAIALRGHAFYQSGLLGVDIRCRPSHSLIMMTSQPILTTRLIVFLNQ